MKKLAQFLKKLMPHPMKRLREWLEKGDAESEARIANWMKDEKGHYDDFWDSKSGK